MVFSEKYRFIYIANPKTATVSIENFLLDIDPMATQRILKRDGKEIPIRGHATAREIKNVLGSEYPSYRTFTFIRDPYSKIVSSYFFFKKGGKSYLKREKSNVNDYLNTIKYFIARILPFEVWSVLYPYKSNLEYIVDQNSERIVDFIGKFESIESDLTKILADIGIEANSHLQKLNRSTHADYSSYYKFGWHKRLINMKIRKDLDYFQKLKAL